MCRTVLAALLVLAASAIALERSDAPGDVHSGPRVACQADRSQPLSLTQTAPPPASATLEQMGPAERENSRISVEFESPNAELLALGGDVERLWNAGDHDEALAQLRDLEARVGIGHVAIGISWRKPVPTLNTQLWNNDVRIGNRALLLDLSFDTQLSSGNLFAVLRSGDSSRFYVNMSHDGGATWSEIYWWNGSAVLPSVDAAVLDNFLYITYSDPGDNAQQVRLRRFSCSDGSPVNFNTGVNWVAACTLAVGDTVRELSLVSNQHGFNNRLYLTTLVSDGSMLFSWDDTGAVSWTKVTTGITAGANHGLDGTENEGFDTTGQFFSYYDATDSLRIYGITNSGCTRRYARHTGTGTLTTSISAYRDTIICAYEDKTQSPAQVAYVINDGDVASWSWGGYLSNTDTLAEAPGVTARGGGGLAIVFRHYTPTRELRFRQRTHYSPGAWNDPVSIADNEPYWNRPGIEYLGSGHFGVAYLSWSTPAIRGAFFDRTDWTGVAEQRRLVMEENILNVTPNPLSGSGRLNYTLNRPADLRVQVYDRTGRVVRTLFDGHSLAGSQSLGFDTAGMTPGVYFVRANADGQTLTVPMTVVK